MIDLALWLFCWLINNLLKIWISLNNVDLIDILLVLQMLIRWLLLLQTSYSTLYFISLPISITHFLVFLLFFIGHPLPFFYYLLLDLSCAQVRVGFLQLFSIFLWKEYMSWQWFLYRYAYLICLLVSHIQLRYFYYFLRLRQLDFLIASCLYFSCFLFWYFNDNLTFIRLATWNRKDR